MIERIGTTLAVGVEKATKKAADAIERVADNVKEAKSDSATDNLMLVKLNSAYTENYQNARSAQDSISYYQMKEATLGNVSGQLQKLRDMSVQYGSPALSDENKASLQSQAEVLVENIEKNLTGSTFNSHKLFADVNINSLGLDGFKLGEGAIDTVDSALSVVNRKTAENGGKIATMEARIDNLSAHNVALAGASERLTGSLAENITEAHVAVTEAMTSMKALGAVMELDKEKVMSLVEMVSSKSKDR